MDTTTDQSLLGVKEKMLRALPEREKLALANWLRMQLCRSSLAFFCGQIDPNAAAKYGSPHMRLMAGWLERIEAGELRRLFITAPPRHWKSSLVSEKFTLWFLSKNPERSVGVFSHGSALPTRFSMNVRSNIISNPRFRQVFPGVELKEGSSNQSDWSLSCAYRSSFQAFGVGAAPTGHGFDLIVIDDPIADAAEAYSKSALDKVWVWYQETLRDRLNPGGAIVMVMSRWHENDLAGRLLRASDAKEGEHWDTLLLKAVAEGPDPMGRKQGEALWPDEWSLDELLRVKQAQGARAFAARYQGSPRAMEGSLLDSGKLKMIDSEQVPSLRRKVRRWDLAFSDSDAADYLSGAKMGVDNAGRRYILHIKRVQGKWTQGLPMILRMAVEDGLDTEVAIEANGTQLGYAQEVKQLLPTRLVREDKPTGNKEMRAALWGSRLEDGIIYCVRGEWNQEFFDEMDYFPNAEHDDMVDAVSGAWGMLDVVMGFGSASVFGGGGEGGGSRVAYPSELGTL